MEEKDLNSEKNINEKLSDKYNKNFNKFIFFDDYNSDELYEIFKSMCDDNNLILEDNLLSPDSVIHQIVSRVNT